MTFVSLIPPIYINVKQYGAVGDGVTDDTTAITNALNAANSVGGGSVFFSAGTYISGNQTLSNIVRVCGPGPSLATIKLKNGANTDLFSANTANINLSGAFGTGPTTGVKGNGWGFSGITLDGNKANQSGGPSWVLRYYGYGEIFDDVIIQNGYSGGVQRDWYAATPNAPSGTWNNVQVSFNNGEGAAIGGPTDLKLNLFFPNNNYNNWHIYPNAGGLNAVNCHSWAPNNTAGQVTSLLLEASSCLFDNCEFEGSNTAQAVILGNRNMFKGWVFAGTATGAGVKIGQQSGETPYLNQINQSAGTTTQVYVNNNIIDVVVTDITNAHGSIWYDADGGNTVRAVTSQSSGVYSSGSPGAGSYDVDGQGLTADGSLGKSSFQQFISNAFLGFAIGKPGTLWMNVDTFDGVIQAFNNAPIIGFSDVGSTTTWQLRNGTLSLPQSATAAVITSAGGAPSTITTSGIGIARVAPTANVTGIILQAGTLPGQHVIVRNESAFTVTFNTTPATSHVADAAAALAIPANTSRQFEWNSVASLWSRCNG